MCVRSGTREVRTSIAARRRNGTRDACAPQISEPRVDGLGHETERLEAGRVFHCGGGVAGDDVFEHRGRVAEVAGEDFAEDAAEIGAFGEVTSAAAAED